MSLEIVHLQCIVGRLTLKQMSTLLLLCHGPGFQGAGVAPIPQGLASLVSRPCHWGQQEQISLPSEMPPRSEHGTAIPALSNGTCLLHIIAIIIIICVLKINDCRVKAETCLFPPCQILQPPPPFLRPRFSAPWLEFCRGFQPDFC